MPDHTRIEAVATSRPAILWPRSCSQNAGVEAIPRCKVAVSTIATYVLLCVYSTAGLQRIHLGAFERYGEVLSGAFIALVGVAFWLWPVL